MRTKWGLVRHSPARNLFIVLNTLLMLGLSVLMLIPLLKVLPRLDDPQLLFTKGYIRPELQPTPWKDPYPISERISRSVTLHQADAVQEELLPISPTYLKVSGDLTALRAETVSKITIGDFTVDEGLKRYKAEADALGMPQILAELDG